MADSYDESDSSDHDHDDELENVLSDDEEAPPPAKPPKTAPVVIPPAAKAKKKNKEGGEGDVQTTKKLKAAQDPPAAAAAAAAVEERSPLVPILPGAAKATNSDVVSFTKGASLMLPDGNTYFVMKPLTRKFESAGETETLHLSDVPGGRAITHKAAITYEGPGKPNMFVYSAPKAVPQRVRKPKESVASPADAAPAPAETPAAEKPAAEKPAAESRNVSRAPAKEPKRGLEAAVAAALAVLEKTPGLDVEAHIVVKRARVD